MAVLSLPHVLPLVANRELELKKYVNFLLALTERRALAERVHARPLEVTIDPSTVCQLACPYCEVGNGTIRRERALLQPGPHMGLLDQLGPAVFLAWYFSTGEPLLNKRLHEIVAQTRGRGTFSIVSTNLSLPLSDARIDELLECGLGMICVSLDGATAETYRRYRVGGEFSLVVENMKRLVERRARLALDLPLVEWRFLAFRHNQHEVAAARALAARCGVDLFELALGCAPPTACGDEVQVATDPSLSPRVWGPALDAGRKRLDSPLRVRLRGRKERFGPAPHASLRNRKCDWLYFGTTLFPSGAVAPCCLSNNEPDDFGRVTGESSFEEIWNGGKYRQARRLFVHPEPNELICSRCPNRDAQDYQFRMTLRALLRNAPDWALAVLERDPRCFFVELDFAFLAPELRAIEGGRFGTEASLAEARRGLEQEAEASPGARDRILGFVELLASHPPRRRRSVAWNDLSRRFRQALGWGRQP